MFKNIQVFKNKQVLFLMIAVIIVFLLFVAVAFLSFTSNRVGQPPSTPAVDIQTGGTDDQDVETIQRNIRNAAVNDMALKLPYKGARFSFYYDYGTHIFTLYIDPAATSEANSEFDAFLRSNGVQNRSWIEEIKVINQKPTP